MSQYPYYRHQAYRDGLRVVGGDFHYVGFSKVALTPTWPLVVPGVKSMRIGVVNGDANVSTGRRQVISTTAGLVCDLSVSGPEGLHPDHTEQNSTVYIIYAAWRGASPEHDGEVCLFAVPSGTLVNAGKVADLYPALPYDYWSQPLGFVVNNVGGNIYRFYNFGPVFRFHFQDYGPQVLSGGTSAIPVAIDLRSFVPREAFSFLVVNNAYQTAANNRTLTIQIKRASGQYIAYINNYSNTTVGSYDNRCIHLEVPLEINPNLQDYYLYGWSGAASTGMSSYIQQVRLY